VKLQVARSAISASHRRGQEVEARFQQSRALNSHEKESEQPDDHIVVTILICVFGIINVPKSFADLKKNLRANIRLGLDLRGGSHLVLQVKVNEAAAGDANQTMERLKDDLKKSELPGPK